MSVDKSMKQTMSQNMKQALETKILQATGFDKYYIYHPPTLTFRYQYGDYWCQDFDESEDDDGDLRLLFESDETKDILKQCILSVLEIPTPDEIFDLIDIEFTVHSPKSTTNPYVDVTVLEYDE